METQSLLIEHFMRGCVEGESTVPRHVETVISHVFIFPERVYKIAKAQKCEFNMGHNDLSCPVVRAAFNQSDFLWNQKLSPELYVQLRFAEVEEGMIMLREEANARAETVYVMKAMSHSSLLYHQLRAGGISEETFESMGRQFAAREHTAAQPDFAPADSFAENVTLRIRDLKDWVLKISHHVPESQLNAWLSFVENGVKEMKRENRPLAVTFDVHSINAFFADGVLLPFDTQPWKKEWFWGPEPMNAYRLATDIFAFSGEEAGRAFLRGYASGTKREVFRAVEEKTWIVYAALIMLAYLYMLGEKDAEKREGAELYRKFLQEYCE